MQLSFAENFDGQKLNTDVWEPVGNGPRRTGWWRPDAHYLDGKGNLVIKIFKDGDKYITGGIQTKSKFRFSYGYYEARVKIQTQPGAWSAFWLWPFDSSAPDAVEIDIFEYGFVPNAPQYALHWYQGGHTKSIVHIPYLNPAANWHTFSFYWDKDSMIWYMDGRTVRKVATNGYKGDTTIILSAEIGKEAFGNIKEAKLPDYYLVDWVKYWKPVK